MTNIPMLGYQFWWSLKGIRVTRPALQQALTATGFDAFLPDPITPHTALRRALNAFVKQRRSATSRSNRTPRDLIRPINQRRAAWMVFALVGEAIDFQDLGLDYGTEARILLEKLPPHELAQREPTLICTTEARGIIQAEDEARALGDALRPLWAQHREIYTASDLSRMVVAIAESLPNVVPLRREGGLYVVPQAQYDDLTRLQTLIEGLPVEGDVTPYLLLFGIPDERTAKRNLARAVHEGFISELRACKADLDDLRAKATTVRSETIAGRLAAFKRVRAKAEAYADLLELQQDAIVREVTALQAQAQALVLAEGDDDDDDAGAEMTPARHDATARDSLPHEPETHVSGDDLPPQARQAA